MTFDNEVKSLLIDLLAAMARAVVTDPASVIVEEVEAPQVLVLNLIVAPNDVGRVIGKKGRVATAMRIILEAAKKDRKRISLNIEPSAGQD